MLAQQLRSRAVTQSLREVADIIEGNPNLVDKVDALLDDLKLFLKVTGLNDAAAWCGTAPESTEGSRAR